uniref:Uncharacterized protein n=1 Tax=Panagrellus redivivus TaxID=6233 RepID=A0A7E4VX96_PANRE
MPSDTKKSNMNTMSKLPCNSDDASGSESEDEKVTERQVALHLPSAHLAERFSRHVGICERSMWELSTLGGAFASMSGYASKWANHLLKVSTFQLMIARKLQNELYESRARIFLANAFASNGHFDKAKEIISKELAYVKSDLKDETILKVATAMNTRIKSMEKKAIKDT